MNRDGHASWPAPAPALASADSCAMRKWEMDRNVWQASSPPVLVCPCVFATASRFVPQFFQARLLNALPGLHLPSTVKRLGPASQPHQNLAQPRVSIHTGVRSMHDQAFHRHVDVSRRQSAVGSDKLSQPSWFLRNRPIPTERVPLFQRHCQLSLIPCLASMLPRHGRAHFSNTRQRIRPTSMRTGTCVSVSALTLLLLLSDIHSNHRPTDKQR